MPDMVPNVLLVEDDENDVFFFQRAMKLAGWTDPVQVAQDGQKAVDYIKGAGPFSRREEFPLPALVLLDLKLPFLSGLEVLKWIRTESEYKQIAVVMLTSSKEEVDVEQACQLGANAYVVKPAAADDLLELVKSIWSFWIKRNQYYPGLIAASSRPSEAISEGVKATRPSPARGEIGRPALEKPNSRAE
jgi:DNA-binding response OmpR family regulator